MRAITKAEFEALEKLIDSTSLRTVLGNIGMICAEKSAHILENWQDERLASIWQAAADHVEKLAEKNVIRRVS